MHHPSLLATLAAGRRADLLASAGGPVVPGHDVVDGGAAPPTPRRRRRAGAPGAALLALVALVGACGDDDEAAAGADTPAAEAPAPDDTPASDIPDLPAAEPATELEVVAGDFGFEVTSDTVAAGLVTVTLTNEGEEAHQVSLVRLEEGVTAEQWVETMAADGELAAFALGETAGGVNPVESGVTASIRTELEPGTYALLCFVPSPGDGVAHIHKGMYGEVEVVDTGSVPVEAPTEVAGEVVMADYAVTPPANGFAESGTYRFRNDGTEPHEVIFLRLRDGKTMEDMIAFQTGGASGEPPFTFEGGVAAIHPGGEAYADLDLRPGQWVALCVIQSPTTHQAHVDMGMLLPFTVG